MLILTVGIVLFLMGWIAATAALLIGAFSLWRAPPRTRHAGRVFMKLLMRTLATGRRRFIWVVALWVYAMLSADVQSALLIALLAFLRYWKYFLEFLKDAFKNEWPYNFLGALGAVMLYFLTGLSSAFSNFVISTITGFHHEEFPGSEAILSTTFIFFSVFFAFTMAAGLAALVTGFTSGTAARVAPVAFMLTVPGLVLLMGWLGRDQAFIDITEQVIISVDFNNNARFESGFYAATDGGRIYGTKVCRALPFETLLAPHSNTGYITATRRMKSPELEKPEFVEKHHVLATQYIYGFVEQKDCPKIQEYFDEAEENSARKPSSP